MANADRCVCCGDIIPEGRQVCRMEVYGTRCLSMTGDMCTMCWCEPMEK